MLFGINVSPLFLLPFALLGALASGETQRKDKTQPPVMKLEEMPLGQWLEEFPSALKTFDSKRLRKLMDAFNGDKAKRFGKPVDSSDSDDRQKGFVILELIDKWPDLFVVKSLETTRSHSASSGIDDGVTEKKAYAFDRKTLERVWSSGRVTRVQNFYVGIVGLLDCGGDRSGDKAEIFDVKTRRVIHTESLRSPKTSATVTVDKGGAIVISYVTEEWAEEEGGCEVGSKVVPVAVTHAIKCSSETNASCLSSVSEKRQGVRCQHVSGCD
jgi:hypothetical protein